MTEGGSHCDHGEQLFLAFEFLEYEAEKIGKEIRQRLSVSTSYRLGLKAPPSLAWP